jgi:hypothetical protein
VFGKEMGNGIQMANISNTDIGLFIWDFGMRISDLISQSAIANGKSCSSTLSDEK